MHGAFLRGIELAGPSGARGLLLRRRRAARLVPVGLALAGFAAMAVELRVGRGALAALFALLSLAVLVLGARAELDSWSFDGVHAVRRTFAPGALGFREVRLRARDIRRVGYVDLGPRSRAWLETRSGEEYALVEGDIAKVQEVAEAWAGAARLSARPPADLHLH